MFVMVAGRQEGKSLVALRWLMEQPGKRFLLVSTQSRAVYLQRLVGRHWSRMSGPALEMIKSHIDTDLNTVRGHNIEEIAIDDLDDYLRTMSPYRVELVTINGTLINTRQSGADTIDGDVVIRQRLEKKTQPEATSLEGPGKDGSSRLG